MEEGSTKVTQYKSYTTIKLYNYILDIRQTKKMQYLHTTDSIQVSF